VISGFSQPDTSVRGQVAAFFANNLSLTQRVRLNQQPPSGPEAARINKNFRDHQCERPVKTQGSADHLTIVRITKITRPGLEQNESDAGETADSENGGHSGGQFESESETAASLKTQAVADLTQAVVSFQAWQNLSACPELNEVTADLLAI
jgi:hypothetical protein